MQIILIGVTDKDCNGDYLLSYFKVTLNLDYKKKICIVD